MKIETMVDKKIISVPLGMALRSNGINTTKDFGNKTMKEIVTLLHDFYMQRNYGRGLIHEIPVLMRHVK